MTSLPLELILLTIWHIGDKESLKSFSLTSSVFRHPCQRILLSHIHIDLSELCNKSSNAGTSVGDRLLELLSSPSKLASYVKRITLDHCTARQRYWLKSVNSRKLAEALNMLHLEKIESFTLNLDNFHIWDLIMEEGPDRLLTVIVKICKSPALIDLSISRTYLDLLAECGSSLKHLRVHNCTQGYDNANNVATPALQRDTIMLKSLQLENTRSNDPTLHFLLDDSSRIQLKELRTLHLGAANGDSWGLLSTFFQACRDTLENLTLVACVNQSNPSRSIYPLPRCPNLVSLHLEVDTTDRERRCLRETVSLINNLAPSNKLETVSLKVEFDLTNIRRGVRGGHGDAWTWSDALRIFGASLTTPGSFPHLNAVTVEIHATMSLWDDVDSVRAWAMDTLAIPAGAALLNLNVHPRTAATPGRVAQLQ